MNSHIFYQGKKFTIEWYCDDRCKSVARDYFNELSFDRKKKLDHLVRTMADIGKIHNEEKFKFEGDQIYAFKPQPDRFLCFFFKGAKIIITNAFEKKTDKLPEKEKVRALNYKQDYMDRIKQGTYYD